MRLGVVVLDVQEVGGVVEGRLVPVQVAHPLVDRGIAGADVADVALEVLDVDRLRASVRFCFWQVGVVARRTLTSNRMMVTNLFTWILSALPTSKDTNSKTNSQPNIYFGNGLPKPVRPLTGRLLEMGLGAVQRLEQRDDVALVRLLGRGEAGLVHAVVDLVVLPLVGLVDLLAKSLGVELDAAVLFVDDVVELVQLSGNPSFGQRNKACVYSPPSQTSSESRCSHC